MAILHAPSAPAGYYVGLRQRTQSSADYDEGDDEMTKTQVGIVGLGFVGKAMLKLFPEALVCDPAVEDSCSMEAINRECDVAFVCVPTPPGPGGTLDTSIVEKVVKNCFPETVYIERTGNWVPVPTYTPAPLVVIRSTLQPGTCDYLEGTYGCNICMQPEYIGETTAHPLLDETARKFLIIGGSPTNRRKLIELYQTVYNANVTIRQVTNLEAEVIKLAENRVIAFKVMQTHELYRVCEAAGVDYFTIREAVYGDDPRFDLWFTFAQSGNLGFQSSKCLAKDVPAFCAWAESVGCSAKLTEQLVELSKKYASVEEPHPYTCDNRPSEEKVK
jgi:UDPglucose 6-dehydrogenase